MRSNTVVRQRYIPPEQDYYDPQEDVQGDFSEFEGKIMLYMLNEKTRGKTAHLVFKPFEEKYFVIGHLCLKKK